MFNSDSFKKVEQKDFSNVFTLANPASSPYLTYLLQKGAVDAYDVVVSRTYDKLNATNDKGGKSEGGDFDVFTNAGSITVDNYCEIFRTQVSVSGTALAMAGKNGMQLVERETLKCTAEMKRDIDTAILTGIKASGTNRKMNGIINLGKKVDVELSQAEIDKAMLHLPIGNLVLVINPANKRKVDKLIIDDCGFTYVQTTEVMGLCILEYISHLGHKVEILLDSNLPVDYYIFQNVEEVDLSELRTIQAVELAKTKDAQGYGLLWEGSILASEYNTYIIKDTPVL